MKNSAFIAMLGLMAAACTTTPKQEIATLTESGLSKEKFQTEINGKQTDLIVLKNSNNMEVCVTNFGGRIVSVMVPDKEGNMKDVVLGFDSIEDYINVPSDFGASIGRYANRIAGGRFTLDNVEYVLPQNNFGHCLHGGPNGYQYKVYDVKSVTESSVTLSYTALDGEEGFPGQLTSDVTFILTDDNAIDIRYAANTTKPTIVNMTNHSYFNLNGDPTSDILDNELVVYADYYTPVDETFMTTGEIATVEGTDMDFRTSTSIGARIDNYTFDQLKNGNGYDHNWVLNTAGDDTQICATLKSPATGIVLDVYTSEPGIQVYTGNFLDGTAKGKNGIVYNQRVAVCLETQKYPDTPNKAEWPSCTLRPEETYSSRCIYKFSVEK